MKSEGVAFTKCLKMYMYIFNIFLFQFTGVWWREHSVTLVVC